LNRSLLLLLVIVVLAGYLGTLIARDPGYVLIAYGDYSMQTSLWVMLGIVLAGSLLFYALLRITGIVRKAPEAYRGWRGHQQTQRASDLTIKGMRLLAEGEYQRARKFLDSGARNNEAKAINYLAAARAADDMDDREGRESYLRLAEETDKSLARARSVVAAELALDRNEPEVALRVLKDIKSNHYISQLKARALRQSSDWKEMLAALPDLKKTDTTLALDIEREAVELGFTSSELDDEARHNLFRSMSVPLKKDPAYIAMYVWSLEDKDVVEPVLRTAIKKAWQPALVALYGELGENTQQMRLKVAEGWQKQHSADAALQYCLGSIYEQGGEMSLARECYARSVELGSLPQASRKLGELLAAEGQYERSVEQLKLAMKGQSKAAE
jgi:HemY protein